MPRGCWSLRFNGRASDRRASWCSTLLLLRLLPAIVVSNCAAGRLSWGTGTY
ncbi:hypothetical protein PF003_g20663 [Phytophthora fragariae]|nr:hypothetical protein PF003_g20663 [Phytophthora fragariae]